MKLSKLAMATIFAASAVSFNSMADSINTGKVNFTGTVVNTPCNIVADDLNQTVDFGQLSKSALKKGVAAEEDFSIRLIDCDFKNFTAGGTTPATKAIKGMKMTFKAENDSYADAGKTMLATSPIARPNNLGISIDGFPFTTAVDVLNRVNIDSSTNTLTFKALAQAVDKSKDVVEGKFAAVATFSISYE